MKAKAVYLATALVLVFSMAAAIVPSAAVALSTGPEPTDVAAEDGVQAALLNLPLYFIENQGQVDQRVAYYVQGRDMNLYFTAQGVTFAMSGPVEEDDSQEHYAIKLEFVGADPDVQPVGKDRTEAVFSYFKGSPEEWKTGLPAYAGVAYPDLWPGIDLVYSGDTSHLKYTFLVQPGADPGQIRLAYDGASALTLNGDGQLEVSTPLGGFSDDQPVAYQDVGGERLPVESSYALDEDTHSYGFEMGSYDPSELLVIDPAVLVYCGYIGGSDREYGYSIAVDGDGCAYVTGFTRSDVTEGFPVFVGPDVTYNGGDEEAFVAKVKADGSGLDYCGYIGGSKNDRGNGIAVDGAGCAYVTGFTWSDDDTEGFPVFVGPDTSYNGGLWDAYVAKVTANGSGLDYCGYIGGLDYDAGNGIAVDGAGCAYVIGQTYSDNTTFPETVGPFTSFSGRYDTFVAKVKANPNSTTPENNYHYCGYIGGSDHDYGNGIAIDDSGFAYVTGYTSSDETAEGFPVTVGPDTSYNGDEDAFVAKVWGNGSGLDYCGYIGGSGDDEGWGIAVDGAGCAYVTGYTESYQATFPETVGPDLSHNGGTEDAFVAKVKANPNSTTTENNYHYCGYIGGSDYDEGRGIAVDGSGCGYVTGWTGSNDTTFPVTVGPDTTHNGGDDAFVARVKANPNDPTPENNYHYCGYIGGSNLDYGDGIAVDGSGCAYVTGYTSSDEDSFPVTMGPDTGYNGGSTDIFVAKVCETEPIMPVGGVIEPVDRLQILAPWLGLAALIVVAIMAAVVIRRHAA
jgi:hypothetical protein